LSQLDESLFSSQESEESNIAAAKDVYPDEKYSAKAPDDKLITSDSGKAADLNPSTSGSTSDNPYNPKQKIINPDDKLQILLM
jgi:hypothetical protein